jgi:hypothetical protein
MRGSLRTSSGGVRAGPQVLFLLTASVLSGALFALPEPLANIVGSVCVLALLWVVLPVRGPLAVRGRLQSAALSAGLGIACVALIFVLDTGATQVLALAALLLGVHILRVKVGQSDSWLPAAGLCLVPLAGFLLLVDASASIDYVVGRYAAFLSSLAGAVAGRATELGQTYAGVSLTVLFILYALALSRFAVSSPRKVVKTVAVCVAVVVIDVAYVALWSRFFGARPVPANPLLGPFIDDYDMRLFLFVMLLIPILLYRPHLRTDGESAPWGRRGLRVAAPLAAVLVVFAVLLAVQPPATPPNRNVLIYDSIPGTPRVDVPVFGSYGLENSGMFGLLPGYLRGRGYRVRVVRSLVDSDLAWAGTLVIFNLRSTLAGATDRAVDRFVERGGSLLVAGDHTGREQIRDPSNALLRPYGIELDFDAAIPLRDGWANGLDMRPHPIASHVSASELRVLVGASLTVTPPARTIVSGRDGYSDPGNAANITGGFLGNMAHDAGERLGDVALVAESSAGAGRVLVFGDTTSFQNGALPFSYRFIDRVFTWLSTAGGPAGWRALPLIAALLLVGCTVVLYATAPTMTVLLVLPVAALLVAVPLSSLVFGTSDAAAPTFTAPYAVIDVSHFEAASRWRGGDSIDGLVLNLQRNGYACFAPSRFDAALVRKADVVVVPTPLEPFSRAQLDAVDACVGSGGLLIITAGSERPAGSYGLLGYYGFRLGTAPLGQAASEWKGHAVHFWSAWPVEMRAGSQGTTLAHVWTYPVAAYRPLGAGGVLVVGDGSFLFNKNLEDLHSYNEQNILFLRALFRAYGMGRRNHAR